MARKLFPFQPDYAVHPGAYLDELLETRGMHQAELAIRLGITKKHLSHVVNGKVPVSVELAHSLEKVFNDYAAKYWLSLQATYDIFVKNKKIEEQYQANKETYDSWLTQFDYTNLVKMGYVVEINTGKSASSKISNLLAFFGCSDIESWNQLYHSNLPAACRISGAAAAKLGNTSSWIRAGQQKAQSLSPSLPRYNKAKFRKSLTEIKDMTTHTSTGFDQRMIDLCANAGVLLLFMREIPRSGICGAAYWVNSSTTPCIQMGLRFKKNDHFWFTFFHEAAHILKEYKKKVYLDCDMIEETDAEMEADRMARNFLIPASAYRDFVNKGHYYKTDIIQFANQIQIHPGIIVGRLQHDKKIEWSWHNDLKETFNWLND